MQDGLDWFFWTGLEKWQTLISGMLALVAGLLTAFLLWRQIQQVRDQEQSQLQGRREAARARLLPVLSEICERSTTRAEQLASRILHDHEAVAKLEMEESKKSPLRPNETKLFPEHLGEGVARLIEVAHRCHIEPLATLASALQIVSSRQVNLMEQNNYSVQKFVNDACDLYGIKLLAQSYFPYARRETDQPPNLPDDFRAADAIHNMLLTSLRVRSIEEVCRSEFTIFDSYQCAMPGTGRRSTP